MEDPRTAGKAGVIRRHARWILPLLAAPVFFYACVLGVSTMAQNDKFDGWWPLVGFLLLIGMFVGPIALIVVSIRNGARTYRDHRRSKGRFSSADLVVIGKRDASARAWRDAQDLRDRLLAQKVPPTLPVWDVVPYANEEFFCDVPIGYARYYGMDVSYGQSSGSSTGVRPSSWPVWPRRRSPTPPGARRRRTWLALSGASGAPHG